MATLGKRTLVHTLGARRAVLSFLPTVDALALNLVCRGMAVEGQDTLKHARVACHKCGLQVKAGKHYGYFRTEVLWRDGHQCKKTDLLTCSDCLLATVDCDCRRTDDGCYILGNKCCAACGPRFWLCAQCSQPLECPECCNRCARCEDAVCRACIMGDPGRWFPVEDCCGEARCAEWMDLCPECFQTIDEDIRESMCTCPPSVTV